MKLPRFVQASIERRFNKVPSIFISELRVPNFDEAIVSKCFLSPLHNKTFIRILDFLTFRHTVTDWAIWCKKVKQNTKIQVIQESLYYQFLEKWLQFEGQISPAEICYFSTCHVLNYAKAGKFQKASIECIMIRIS